jgi:FdhD protein
MKGSGYLPPGAFSFSVAGNLRVEVQSRVHLPRACGLDTVRGTGAVSQYLIIAIQEECRLPAPRSIEVTQVTEWADGKLRRVQDSVAGEEPLEIRIGERPLAVTMRTPGNDLELAAGFLFTEGLIQSREQLASLGAITDGTRASRGNVVVAELAEGVTVDAEQTQRNFFANSSCGVCGKASIDAVRSRLLRPPNAAFRVGAETLCRMPERLGSSQDIFGRTGGLHAAGLFSVEGELLVSREDIGRHNAVDKVVGWALQENRLPLSNVVLLVSGRCGFEIAQKAIVAGIPVVGSVSAPSSLAAQLARELNLTLVGFLRGRRFVIYSGEARLQC